MTYKPLTNPKVGVKALYYAPTYNIKVVVTLVANVEGWWEVDFNDGSRAIIRPSRLFQYEEKPHGKTRSNMD